MTTAKTLGIAIPAALGVLVGAAFVFKPKQAKKAAKSVLSVASRANTSIPKAVRVASTRVPKVAKKSKRR
jgi:hypothetical protein